MYLEHSWTGEVEYLCRREVNMIKIIRVNCFRRGFIVQSVEHRTGITEVMGSKLVGASDLFHFYLCGVNRLVREKPRRSPLRMKKLSVTTSRVVWPRDGFWSTTPGSWRSDGSNSLPFLCDPGSNSQRIWVEFVGCLTFNCTLPLMKRASSGPSEFTDTV